MQNIRKNLRKKADRNSQLEIRRE